MSDGQVHSKIGASSMYRWSSCPGSVRMSEGIKSVSSAYAEEGTRAHSLAADILTSGKFNPLGVPQEMSDAVLTYVDTVMSDAGLNNKINVEIRFDLSEIFPGLFGTADAVVYDPALKLLRVYDYKHGSGIIVEVEDNPQLKYYGLGALLASKYPASEVELVIVQPRANHPNGPVRRWRFKSFDLVEFAADLRDFAEATTKPNAPLYPGDHCRFCPAAGICPALNAKAMAIAQTEFKPALSYDPVVLSETLRKVDILEAYAKSVRAFAYAEAEHGRCPPGWKLVEKRATRKWARSEEETLKELKKNWGLKDSQLLDPPTLKSPAQVEKLFDKKKKSELEPLITAVSSGLTLVEESDKRPPALNDARTEFTKIESPEENIFN